MTTYKVITTICWKFESDKSHEECLELAKHQLEEILETKPTGGFDGFTVHVDLAQMKDRKRLVHLGSFSPEDVFPFITQEESKREYVVGNKSYTVRMNSDRYHVFKANNQCVSCGLAGTKMMLDMNPSDASPHFNLYAEENGRLVLMTKDHVLPKSKGGQDAFENYVTCCSICNNLKGNHDLTYVQLKELRRLHNNQDKLTRKELRQLINSTREEFARRNNKGVTNDSRYSTDSSQNFSQCSSNGCIEC